MPVLPQNGDVVVLKSGGPRMTIIATNGDTRTAGWMLYGSFLTLTADAAAFAFQGTPDPETDTASTDVIPRLCQAALGETLEEFQIGFYTLTVTEAGDRTMTVDLLVPTNSATDFSEATLTVTVEFVGVEDTTLDVTADYISTSAVMYFEGTLVRSVRIAFPEPEIPPAP